MQPEACAFVATGHQLELLRRLADHASDCSSDSLIHALVCYFTHSFPRPFFYSSTDSQIHLLIHTLVTAFCIPDILPGSKDIRVNPF